MRVWREVVVGLILVGVGFQVSAQSKSSPRWSGWRGGRRDGKSRDTGLLKSWPDGGPERLWQVRGLGEGFSGPAIAYDTVYITGGVDGKLIIFAYDLRGRLRWQKEHGEAWTRSYPGARATPTLSKGKLYLLSGPGKLGCYDAKSGRRVWSKEMRSFGGKPGGWGYAESVLIASKYAFVVPGGTNCMVALDKQTGKVLWQSEGNGGQPHYGSSILAIQDKVPMVIGSSRNGLFAVHPKNGRVLWRNDFSSGNTANCPTPAYSDGYLFWATGYGKGGICLRLNVSNSNVTARQAWRTRDMVCHHGGYLIHDGYIYGNNGGGWACLDLKTGEKMWSDRGVGKGSVCYADGMLYLFGEKGGRVGLAKASPDGFRMSGQFSVKGSGPSWAHPVVVGGRLYLRYADNLYCYDVKE